MTKPETATKPPAINHDQLVLALGAQINALFGSGRALTGDAAMRVHADLGVAAYHIMQWLRAFGPAKVSQVAQAMAMDRSATTRLTKQLIGLGIVEAMPNQTDGRSVLLALTTAGHRKAEEATLRKGAEFYRRIEGWSDADLVQLTELLRRFNGVGQR